MRNADAVLLDDGDVLLVEVDAVRGQRALAVKEARLLDVAERTLAVGFRDLLDLSLRLRHVDVDLRAERLRRLCDLLEEVWRAGVRRVRAEHDRDAAIGGAVEVLIEGNILLDFGIAVRRDADDAAREHGAQAGIGRGLRDLLHVRPVHVGKRRRAALDHLDGREHRAPVDVLFLHLRLSRPDHVVEPVHEVHVVRIAAEQRHRGVRVGIDKTRHGKLVLAVDDLGRAKVLRHLADGCNLVAVDHDIRQRRRAVGQQRVYVLDQCLHAFLPQAMFKYAFCSGVSASMAMPDALSLISAIFVLISSGMRWTPFVISLP